MGEVELCLQVQLDEDVVLSRPGLPPGIFVADDVHYAIAVFVPPAVGFRRVAGEAVTPLRSAISSAFQVTDNAVAESKIRPIRMKKIVWIFLLNFVELKFNFNGRYDVI